MTVDRVDDTFLPTGEGFCYAFTTGMRHLYWGGPIDRADIAALAADGRYRAGSNTLSGGYAAETNVRRHDLGTGRLVPESRRGVHGHAHQPWPAVDGGAGEEHGAIWSVAVAHGGSWKLVAELSGDGHTHVTAGLNDFDLRLAVAAGETAQRPVPARVGPQPRPGRPVPRRRQRHRVRRRLPDAPRPAPVPAWRLRQRPVRPRTGVTGRRPDRRPGGRHPG